jgi:subfamily B ATP-binding cassette protein MsbA
MVRPAWIRSYLRLWSLVLEHRALLAVAVAAMIGGAVATAGIGLLAGPAIKMLFAGGAPPAWLARILGTSLQDLRPELLRASLPAAFLVLGLIRAACSFLQAERMARVELLVVTDLQERLHAKLLTLSRGYFQRQHTAELFARFGGDLGEIGRAMGQGVSASLKDGAQLVALLLTCALLNPGWLLVALLVVPVTLTPIVRFGQALRKLTAQSQQRQAELLAQAQDALEGAAVLAAYNAEEAALNAQRGREAELLAVQRKSFALRAAFTPTLDLLWASALALALLAVGLRTELASEKLISFLAILFLAYQPLKSLANSSQWLIPGLTAAERVFAVLDAAPEIADRPDARILSRARGGLRFESVGVRFGSPSGSPSGSKLALDEVDLHIRPGETVGIVGPSGAGKSTLLQLVPRLLDPDSGRMLLDGVDLKDVTLASLRRQIALVAQETFLFDATVAENVSAAAPGATRRQVEEALEAAGALRFVRQLPAGLDTQLGERAATLSGGQRQRLAIARALLKDAPILLLDEATSALDSETEEQIQAALVRLRRGRTALMVAHRLATVASADRIVVLREGRVVQDGTPDQLRSQPGLYRELLDLQTARPPEGSAPGSLGPGKALEAGD